jgi:hypothetical protein
VREGGAHREECRAAKKQTIIVDHGEVSVRVVLKEDWERWANDTGAGISVEPPQQREKARG